MSVLFCYIFQTGLELKFLLSQPLLSAGITVMHYHTWSLAHV
jgi:hypothetical protein